MSNHGSMYFKNLKEKPLPWNFEFKNLKEKPLPWYFEFKKLKEKPLLWILNMVVDGWLVFTLTCKYLFFGSQDFFLLYAGRQWKASPPIMRFFSMDQFYYLCVACLCRF